MDSNVVAAPERLDSARTVTLNVNGHARELRIEPRVSLLDALREHLGLTGSKKGCDQGTCGACTVLVNGRRVLACLTLAVTCEGREVTTIEGLSADGQLHPMQAAFVARDAFQCGSGPSRTVRGWVSGPRTAAGSRPCWWSRNGRCAGRAARMGRARRSYGG
jgi:xanthine dehydrogenase YagT iron-sulfur-binding subunit